MKEKIPTYLRPLLALAESGKSETIITVHVTLTPEGEPVPTVGAFAESIDEEAAGRMVGLLRQIGQELRASHEAGGGGPYPPPPKPLDAARFWNCERRQAHG